MKNEQTLVDMEMTRVLSSSNAHVQNTLHESNTEDIEFVPFSTK